MTPAPSSPASARRGQIFVLSQHDVRKNRSDPVHIMNFCSAFAANGYPVELVTPSIFRKGYETPINEVWNLYGLSPSFAIWEIPTALTNKSSTLSFRLQRIGVALRFVAGRFAALRRTETIVYNKCYTMTQILLLLRALGLIRARLVLEKPDFNPDHRQHRWVCQRVDRIITSNKFIADQVEKQYRYPSSRLYSLGPVSQYNVLSKLPIIPRESLKFTPGKRHIIYSGKTMPDWLECRYILEAARLVPEHQFIIIGGSEAALAELREWCRTQRVTNVTFPGFLPVPELFSYLRQGDLLVSYYDTKDPISAQQRSPGKLTLYACTGNPIIVADLPSMRELLTEDEAFFVPPDDPPLLARNIRSILDNPAEAARRGAGCLEYGKRNDYTRHYARIADFIQSAAPS